MAIKTLQAGVTLVEMVVVVAIVAVVSVVVVFNYSSFNNIVSLRQLSQEVGLTVRRAQAFATSVRNLKTGGVELYPAYGIAFSAGSSVGSATAPYDKKFILFADIPASGSTWGDGMYTGGSTCGAPSSNTDECTEQFSIASADKVVRLCADIGVGGTESCFSDKEVDIVFRRPSPDARICVVQSGVCLSTTPSYVKVILQSPKGIERMVTIWNTGQISAQ